MKQDDETVTLSTAAGWVRDFCERRGWDLYHGPKDLAIGLTTESAELLELFRFRSEKDIDGLIESPEFRAAVADELADSLYFILRFAQLYKFDLAEGLAAKLEKNAKKYPAPDLGG